MSTVKLVTSELEVKSITDRGGEINVLISPSNVISTKLIMGTATVPVGGKVLKHSHPYGDECFYVLSGIGSIDIEGYGVFQFEAGQAVLTPQGAFHSIENTGDEQIKVVFASAPLAPSSENGHVISL
jgi:putative monooxygenase